MSLQLPETTERITPPDVVFTSFLLCFLVHLTSLPFSSRSLSLSPTLVSTHPLSFFPPVMPSWSRMRRTDGPVWAPSSSASSRRSRRPRWPPMLTSHRSWANSANRARRRLPPLLLLLALLPISEHQQDLNRSRSLFFYATQTKLHPTVRATSRCLEERRPRCFMLFVITHLVLFIFAHMLHVSKYYLYSAVCFLCLQS